MKYELTGCQPRTSVPLNPFGFPEETRSIYASLNLFAASMGLSIALNFVSFGEARGPALAGWLVLQAAAALHHFVGPVVRWRRSTPVDAGLHMALDRRFPDFAGRVEYRLTDRGDYYASQSPGHTVCYIPRGLAYELARQLAGGSPSRLREVFRVAHELGHIASGDSRDFSRCLLFGASATVSGIYLMVLQFWTPGWLAIKTAAVASVAWSFAVMLYDALRYREFYADAAAGYLLGDSGDVEVSVALARLALQERSTRRPWLEGWTHPSFAQRSDTFRDFPRVHDYTAVRAFSAGTLLALLLFAATVILEAIGAGLPPLAGNLFPDTLTWADYIRAVVILLSHLVLSLFVVSGLIGIATLSGRLGLAGCLGGGLVFGAATLATFHSLVLRFFGYEVADRYFDGWFGFRLVVLGVLTHYSVWKLLRHVLTLRGPKRPGPWFRWQCCGGVFAAWLMTVLGYFIYASLVAGWAGTSWERVFPEPAIGGILGKIFLWMFMFGIPKRFDGLLRLQVKWIVAKWNQDNQSGPVAAPDAKLAVEPAPAEFVHSEWYGEGWYLPGATLPPVVDAATASAKPGTTPEVDMTLATSLREAVRNPIGAWWRWSCALATYTRAFRLGPKSEDVSRRYPALLNLHLSVVILVTIPLELCACYLGLRWAMARLVWHTHHIANFLLFLLVVIPFSVYVGLAILWISTAVLAVPAVAAELGARAVAFCKKN